jgi:hypothetical protein
MKSLARYTIIVALALAGTAFAKDKECQKQCALKCSQNNQSCMSHCKLPKQKKDEPMGPSQDGKMNPGMECMSACGKKIADCVKPCDEKC